MSYQTHPHFLDKDFFNKLKQIILDQDFPWRRRDSFTGAKKDTQIFFSYSFYQRLNNTSELYAPFIVPILNKLKATAPLRVQANLLISKLFNKSKWHRDSDLKCKAAILYLNKCDGGTELKINNKIIFIKAQPNTLLVFDSDVLHRAITSQTEPIRYIINFNYFTDD